ncbi:MAG: hypothetical protein ACOY46_19655 [Bacillota bacterium]
MSKIKKNKNHQIDKGFILEYNKLKRRNFKGKALDIIQEAKSYKSDSFRIIATLYDDSLSQVIGSLLSTLIYKAAKEPDNYLNNRYYYLKEVADIIKKENAYKELFSFIKTHHSMRFDSLEIENQLIFELDELVNMITPMNMYLVGLDNEKPIFIPSKFPYTKNFLGKINQLPSEVIDKKTKPYVYQNWARSFLENYYSRTFGFYRRVDLDLVPYNSINLEYFEKHMKLPRKLLETDDILEVIRNKRKYVINKNGVVIDCYNAGDIETILIVENDGYLLYKVIFKEKGWVVDNKGNLVDDINGAEYTGIIDCDSFVKDYLYCFSYLDFIAVYVDKCFDILDFVMECYADLVCGTEYHYTDKKIDSFNQILYDSAIEDDEIEKYFKSNNSIGIRYTPKNIYNEGKRTTSRTSKTTREKYFVSGHIRKLADGYSASPEAIRNAEEYGIHVPKGFTFVSPYYTGIEKVRTYYRKVVE